MAIKTKDVRRRKHGSDVFSESLDQSGSESAQIPVRLGMYALLKPLGRGGMARVFLADHVAMKRLAAIKVLPSSAAQDPVLLERMSGARAPEPS